jgi:hypothetical protein
MQLTKEIWKYTLCSMNTSGPDTTVGRVLQQTNNCSEMNQVVQDIVVEKMV